MPDPEHQNERVGIDDSRDYAVVADPISPKLAKLVAFQRLTDRTRIFERGYPVAKKAKNTARGLGIELGQFARRSRANSILHAMAVKQVVQRNRLAPAVAQVLEAPLGEIEILELVKVTKNRLSRIEALRAIRALGEFGEPGLDSRRKAKSEHEPASGRHMSAIYEWRLVFTDNARMSGLARPTDARRSGGSGAEVVGARFA
jgi:hypothetical protein